MFWNEYGWTNKDIKKFKQTKLLITQNIELLLGNGKSWSNVINGLISDVLWIKNCLQQKLIKCFLGKKSQAIPAKQNYGN